MPEQGLWTAEEDQLQHFVVRWWPEHEMPAALS
jgi:hypothetical protein